VAADEAIAVIATVNLIADVIAVCTVQLIMRLPLPLLVQCAVLVAIVTTSNSTLLVCNLRIQLTRCTQAKLDFYWHRLLY
jgi:hypothetical protein